MFYVYVLQNPEGRHYTGHTSDLTQRVGQHNVGTTKSTKNRGPWNCNTDRSSPPAPKPCGAKGFLNPAKAVKN